jgi:SWI/SNF-related matrix-associated actin-dependent regulator of chromatin subfamily A-like protein 1
VDVLRHTPTRVYHGNQINSIEPRAFAPLQASLKEAGVELGYASPEVQASVTELLNRPNFVVSLDGRGNRLVIKPGHNVNSNMFLRIPGHKWDYDRKVWTVPVWEGWRVYEQLKVVERVVWEDDASQLIVKDMEKRAQLEELAQQKDIPDFVLDLNTHMLRPFQKVGTCFVVAAGYKGIIADKPGLGKTPQFIATVKLLERELGRPVRAAVVCPANAKRNWQTQILKFTGEPVKMFRGLEPSHVDLLTLMHDGMKPKWAIFNYDILGRRTIEQVDKIDEAGRHIAGEVTRYLWIDLINLSNFDIVGIDEAHYIKNVDSHRSQAIRKLNCPRVVFLTGTPVTNRPRELWPMLTMINSDLFPSHEVFLNTYEDGYGNARNSQELVELLKPIMIRRTHKDVMADLPPVERVYNFYSLSPKALKIYNKVLDGIYEDWIKHEGQEMAVTNMLARITRLKQICATDKMDSVAELATDTYDQASDEDNPKVLIFTQFLNVARGIARRLGQEALIVTGAVPQEQRPGLVEQFQTDPKVHFMVSTKGTLGEALDLTKAGYIIFADYFWTPGAHEQCEGRAYGRMSDPHSIVSYYCTSQIENGGQECIEEWIQQILARKLAVIETVVDGVEANRNASIANELLERMKQELFSRKAK